MRISLVVVVLLQSAASAKPPNVLLIVADDLTYRDVGCYGNRDVKTPRIDSLARDGLKLTHCFTATAMCAPTRQQLYTGIFPVKNGAYPNHSRVFDGTKSFVHYFKKGGYRVGLAGKRHFGPAKSFPFEAVTQGKKFNYRAIREFVARKDDQPFFLVFASNEPHLPWNQGDASQFPPEQLTIPPDLFDTPETRKGLSKYYAEISHLDGQVGKCLDILKQTKTASDTIVIFTSEQGSQMPFGKWTCYDNGLRTATLIRWPGKIKAGSTSGAMTQYVDIVPTLLDAAGLPIPQGLDGRGFKDVLFGKKAEHREFVYGVHTTRGIIAGSESYPIRSVRSRRFKYIRNLRHQTKFKNVLTSRDVTGIWKSWVAKGGKAGDRAAYYQSRPAEELYDVTADPFEQKNLAADPKYREVKAKLAKELAAWMKHQGDEGHATEMKAKERQGRKRRAKSSR